MQDEGASTEHGRSRRLVHRKALDEKGRFEGRQVVATRFVRACPRGHVDDLDWYAFAHQGVTECRRQLWLDERGTSGDLAELVVRCECGKQRRLSEAMQMELSPLGMCRGARPWLGGRANEPCSLPNRLLTRTASNSYFPQVLSVLSLPDPSSAVGDAVAELWDDLQIVQTEPDLSLLKRKSKIAQKLASFSDEQVMEAIKARRAGAQGERPVKEAELDALTTVPEGFADDGPVDRDFHARRLPERIWRNPGNSRVLDGIEAVIQVHRLREVQALIGFTRMEPIMPEINGEYENNEPCAKIALEPSWFPAVENRGEGIFIQLRPTAVRDWLAREGVKRRLTALATGHDRWKAEKKREHVFPGGPYVLLHTLSHLLMQSLALRCGYPASALKERIYVDYPTERFALLLYTASPDAEGTLGGLVQQGRLINDHLSHALRIGALCSNDPICANHSPEESMERRWLHGAACHGCLLASETSCEMRNDYLDRALVVPVLGCHDAAYFPAVS